jgi:hypothetical protein
MRASWIDNICVLEHFGDYRARDGFRVNLMNSPAFEHAPCVPDAHQAGSQITGRGQGEAKGAPSDKAKALICGADVVCLARALAIGHGQQNAGRGKELRHNGVKQENGNQKADDCLEKVG